MSWKKKRVGSILILLSIAVLCACSSKEYGTKEKPAGVGQTMYYDGLEATEERNRFQAEITLEDVVRGEPPAAMRITEKLWNSVRKKNSWLQGLHLHLLRQEVIPR